VLPSCCNCPVDKTAEAIAVATCHKKIFLDSAVDGCAGAPSLTLVVGKSVLGNYSSFFVDCVLRHYVHWCHIDPRNICDAGEGDGKAVPVFDIFADKLSKEVWLGQGTLVVAKGESIKNVLFSCILAYVE
jgi:hypothetical protein